MDPGVLLLALDLVLQECLVLKLLLMSFCPGLCLLMCQCVKCQFV